MSKLATTSLRGLRTFCVAARYKSFRAAAEALYVTPSAVSHQVRALEDHLGIALFHRSSRDISLTENGQALYVEVSPLIEQIDDIVGHFRSGARRTTVRISVQPFLASEYFVPRLGAFSSAHPDIDIQVGTSDEASEKHPTDADLSIRLFTTPPAGFAHKALFGLRLVPAGSPAFKKAIKKRGKKVSSDFPLIVHETLAKAWPDWKEQTGMQLPEHSKVTRFDSMIAVVRAAQQGMGAALIPMPISELWIKEGSLVRLFDEELVTGSAYYLIWKPDEKERQSVRLLREWILATFGPDG